MVFIIMHVTSREVRELSTIILSITWGMITTDGVAAITITITTATFAEEVNTIITGSEVVITKRGMVVADMGQKIGGEQD